MKLMLYRSIVRLACRLPARGWWYRMVMTAALRDAAPLKIALAKREIERHLRRRGTPRSAAMKLAAERLAGLSI
jgi:hypothetical protein